MLSMGAVVCLTKEIALSKPWNQTVGTENGKNALGNHHKKTDINSHLFRRNQQGIGEHGTVIGGVFV
jgi:hypothetical protein